MPITKARISGSIQNPRVRPKLRWPEDGMRKWEVILREA